MKVNDVDESVACGAGAFTPVPVAWIVCVPALSVMVNGADSVVRLAGLNAMVTVQLAFTARVVAQLLVWVKSKELAGETEVITSGLVPALVTVTGICAEVFTV